MACPTCKGQTFDGIRDFVEYKCAGAQPGCSVVFTRPVDDDAGPVVDCPHCKQPRNVKSTYRRVMRYCAQCVKWV